MRRFVALTALLVVLASGVSFAGEKAKPPKEYVELLQFYVGEWSVEGTVGETPLKGRASFRMPAGNFCILGTVSARVGKEPLIFSLVSGWDSSTGWGTEQGVGNDGGVYRLEWRKVSATVDEGELVGTVDGKKVTEKDRLERKGDDEFVVVCTERKEGDKSLPDMTLRFHKRAREKGKRKAAK